MARVEGFQAADWSITRSNGNIRYIGDDHNGANPSYVTVIDFHRAIQAFADDAVSSGDDELDITDSTPSDRSTDNIITLINGYNIDDTAAEHIYDGSIIQAGGATIYDGIVNFGNSTQIQIHQNGAVLADDWWNQDPGAAGYGLNSDIASGISHRFMVKVRDAGSDIDGRRLLGTTRNFGKTYFEFSINGSSRGNNVLALSELNDLNNQTAIGTIAAIVDITNVTEGYNGIDVSGDGADEFYYSEWDRGANSINTFYEYAKWLTRDGSASTLYGINGELFRGITHEIDIDWPTWTFNAFEAVSWTGGTGQMLAIDSTTAGTKMWIQLLTGVAPTDNLVITGGTSSATATVNVTVTERNVSPVFVGQSTGTAIIGSYGLGIQSTDLTASDSVTDLANSSVTPPNNVTFNVVGVVSGEDRILVWPEAGGVLDESQLSLSTALTTDNITSVVVTTAIPSDTPSSGTIRVADNNGVYRRLEYSSYTGSTFTITTTDGNEDFATVNASSANNVYISYIDKLAGATTESFTSVYSSDRSLYIRVRDGAGTPIKTFETTGTLGSAGGSTTVIRTSDA